MSEKAAKGLFFFLLTMVVFTFFSWKLDILRTPQALCVQPVQMELAGKDYHFVLPVEAASGEGVWVAGESKSVFCPYTARWGRVTAGASEGGWTAVDGISVRCQVVWFSDRTLAGGGTVPVRLWEERPLAGRVEVLCPAEGEAALREAMVRYEKEWDLSWEADRLVVETVDLFTAQQVEAALRQAGWKRGCWTTPGARRCCPKASGCGWPGRPFWGCSYWEVWPGTRESGSWSGSGRAWRTAT